VKNDFSAAADALSEYLSAHAGDALRAQALLYRGWALEMSVGWGAAQPVYAQVEAFRDFDADRWAARWAARRANAPMSPADSTLLLARTAFDAARTDEAEAHARTVLYAGVSGTTQDDRAEAAYRLGRVYHVQERHDDALVHYRQAVQLRGDDRAKWAPYALYHIGQIHAERGHAEAARTALKQAIDWPTPYDFSDGLEQMATHLRDGR
jgi:tetratricopeptide (TPR) repeat protein